VSLPKPHPRVWIPGVISPETVVWAAEHGYPYIALNTPIDRTKRFWEIYDNVAAKAIDGGRAPISRPAPRPGAREAPAHRRDRSDLGSSRRITRRVRELVKAGEAEVKPRFAQLANFEPDGSRKKVGRQS
jgi:alkanesulfonate monooxygenase SsuD/methylene tetrahydromethanopterin reductase-like flavin-dependent oxidoreductase (luciferase family)